MDKWGILILIAGIVLYYVSKKQIPAYLFLAGVGAGIVIGAVWSYLIVMSILP